MRFLLDTNVFSEWMKPRPDPGVVAWLDSVDEDRVLLSVVTLAELRRGIVRLQAGPRQKRLDEWLRPELLLRFENRVLPIDAAVADAWGEIVASRHAMGHPIAAMDAMIAATARVHHLTLITRNEVDFQGDRRDDRQSLAKLNQRLGGGGLLPNARDALSCRFDRVRISPRSRGHIDLPVMHFCLTLT